MSSPCTARVISGGTLLTASIWPRTGATGSRRPIDGGQRARPGARRQQHRVGVHRLAVHEHAAGAPALDQDAAHLGAGAHGDASRRGGGRVGDHQPLVVHPVVAADEPGRAARPWPARARARAGRSPPPPRCRTPRPAARSAEGAAAAISRRSGAGRACPRSCAPRPPRSGPGARRPRPGRGASSRSRAGGRGRARAAGPSGASRPAAALEASAPGVARSKSVTRHPRLARSAAVAQPMMPPPITATEGAAIRPVPSASRNALVASAGRAAA